MKRWHKKVQSQGPGFGAGSPGGGPIPWRVPGGGAKKAPDLPAQPDQPPPAAQKKPAPKGEPLAMLKTNAAGLAEFKITPKADQLRTANWGQQDIEMLGGKQQRWGPQILFDLHAVAK